MTYRRTTTVHSAPGVQNNELHWFFVCRKYEKIRPNVLKNIEPHHEHSQFVKLMLYAKWTALLDTCHVVVFSFSKCFETRHKLRVCDTYLEPFVIHNKHLMTHTWHCWWHAPPPPNPPPLVTPLVTHREHTPNTVGDIHLTLLVTRTHYTVGDTHPLLTLLVTRPPNTIGDTHT